MIYKEFMDKYGDVIDCLDVYNACGEEIGDDIDITPDTKILEIYRRSGWFDIVIDM